MATTWIDLSGAAMFRPFAAALTLLILSTAWAQPTPRPNNEDAGTAGHRGAATTDDTTSAQINEALDKQAKLAIKALLPQAMEQIQEQAGVPIKIDPAVWDLLPWGRNTNIIATIDNQTLRQALDAITRKLGLRFEIKNDTLVIEPVPALRRVARRTTKDELDCLDTLNKLPLDKSGAMTLKTLLDAIDAKLAAAKTPFAVDRPGGDQVALTTEINIPRNSTVLDALDSMARQTAATWYPWGKTVVVVAKQDQIKRQLTRTITVRYSSADVAQVLTDLSQKAGVPFDIEPGALQQLPPEARGINLILEDYTIHDALEAIRGLTGLDFMVREGGVYIWNQATSPTRRDRVLISMQVHGTDLIVFIPESQVPPDIKEYISSKTKKQFDNLRDMMKEEGFKPSATQPTTKPVGKPAEKTDKQDL